MNIISKCHYDTESEGREVSNKSARTWACAGKNLKEYDASDSRQHQVDEVEVFGLFGGDLPVIHHSRKLETENEWATVHTTFEWVLENSDHFHECAGKRIRDAALLGCTFVKAPCITEYNVCFPVHSEPCRTFMLPYSSKTQFEEVNGGY
ncbi:hypothetical protein CJP46_33075 [Paenibacillus sp. XY044]|nr:hypothetical protein CJP46_33075 [Paenibacillus sp. XY044]